MSNDGEKVSRNYRATLKKVFEDLNEVALTCEDPAVEWNFKALPDKVQQKYEDFHHQTCNQCWHKLLKPFQLR